MSFDNKDGTIGDIFGGETVFQQRKITVDTAGKYTYKFIILVILFY